MLEVEVAAVVTEKVEWRCGRVESRNGTGRMFLSLGLFKGVHEGAKKGEFETLNEFKSTSTRHKRRAGMTKKG